MMETIHGMCGIPGEVELLKEENKICVTGRYPTEVFKADVPIDVVERALLEDNVGEKGKQKCWLKHRDGRGIILSIYVVDDPRNHKEAHIWFEESEYQIEFFIVGATEMKDEFKRALHELKSV